ncbi:hypothetical protein GCM10023336_47060 [Streptomyces similanensis]|uniref:Uncharacterized protein n=1 Tax=Streptomyces similanensis TaxID=1274988 RepID=A0ABP9KYS9_9ACTN
MSGAAGHHRARQQRRDERPPKSRPPIPRNSSRPHAPKLGPAHLPGNETHKPPGQAPARAVGSLPCPYRPWAGARTCTGRGRTPVPLPAVGRHLAPVPVMGSRPFPYQP